MVIEYDVQNGNRIRRAEGLGSLGQLTHLFLKDNKVPYSTKSTHFLIDISRAAALAQGPAPTGCS